MSILFGEAVGMVREAGSFTSADSDSRIETARGWVARAYEGFVRDTGCFGGSFADKALTVNVVEYDVATVTAKTDILRFMELTYTGSGYTDEPMDPIDPSLWAQRLAGSPSQGAALMYTTIGYNVLLLGTPPASGDTISGWYAKRPAALSAYTDASTDVLAAVPGEYHDAIIAGALVRGMKYENRFDEAREWDRQYNQLVEECKSDLQRYRGRKPTQMVPSRLEDGYPIDGSWDYKGTGA